MSTWNIDSAHSMVGFKVKHLMVSTVRGSFTGFSGKIESADDSFENAKVEFSADAKSISTHNDMRDGHLRSPEFFDVEQFPTLGFTSTSFVKNGDAYAVSGDLTMHGVTKPVTLSAELGGIGTGMDGKRVVHFAVTGKISRTDFGLTYSAMLETGGMVVGNEITLDIEVEAVEA
jgi:polyisoprenoid-binding protein YceI